MWLPCYVSYVSCSKVMCYESFFGRPFIGTMKGRIVNDWLRRNKF